MSRRLSLCVVEGRYPASFGAPWSLHRSTATTAVARSSRGSCACKLPADHQSPWRRTAISRSCAKSTWRGAMRSKSSTSSNIQLWPAATASSPFRCWCGNCPPAAEDHRRPFQRRRSAHRVATGTTGTPVISDDGGARQRYGALYQQKLAEERGRERADADRQRHLRKLVPWPYWKPCRPAEPADRLLRRRVATSHRSQRRRPAHRLDAGSPGSRSQGALTSDRDQLWRRRRDGAAATSPDLALQLLHKAGQDGHQTCRLLRAGPGAQRRKAAPPAGVEPAAPERPAHAVEHQGPSRSYPAAGRSVVTTESLPVGGEEALSIQVSVLVGDPGQFGGH